MIHQLFQVQTSSNVSWYKQLSGESKGRSGRVVDHGIEILLPYSSSLSSPLPTSSSSSFKAHTISSLANLDLVLAIPGVWRDRVLTAVEPESVIFPGKTGVSKDLATKVAAAVVLGGIDNR
jgi:hypothetical protein